ncbi:MAG TPA: cyanophycin synthetase [Gemmatimonadaceae bacterium]|nr:cyanophycin synthetase [Gemmatimonadaceae bacterium]
MHTVHNASMLTATQVAERAEDLRVTGARTLGGPNIWQLAPVVVAELRLGSLAGVAPNELTDFITRLRHVVPSLDDVASWGDVLVRVSNELQRRAGSPVSFGHARDVPADELTTVVIGFDEAELATAALFAGARVLRDCLRGNDPEVESIVADLTRRYHRARPGPTTLVMIEAARRRGIPVRRNPDDAIVQLGLGAAQRRLHATMTDFTSAIATEITSDKHWTKTALERVGLATPRGDTARTLEGALEIADDIGFPVLLKPLDANNGRGISGRIDSLDEVRAAWPLAAAEHPVVVVERFAEGNDHRVLVVNRRVIACVERIPAHVVGDGRRTIRELAVEINRDPRRSKTDPNSPLSLLPLDERTAAFLARSDRTLETVPNDGEVVSLRATANISTGGTAVDRTDEMHPRNRTLCELAAGAVGLDVAGLDVLTPDISVPFDENGAVIIEVNASPGIRMHTHPDNGIARDVPGAILDMLYPPGSPTTVPVIAVTGTNGKTTTTRLIAHLFRAAGKRVGFTTTDGVYYEDHLLLEGDLTGPFAANIILSHRDVEVAVLETARGGILRAGLGFETCDVGVVLNTTADHLGLGGIDTVEQLAQVKGIIAAVVKPTGHAVLNADDPLVLAMRDKTPGAVVLTTMSTVDPNTPAGEHLARGGMVACVEPNDGDEQIVILEGTRRVVLATTREVPLTFGGSARFQIENILAASAAAYVQGVPVDRIREGLLSFLPSLAQTPGRLNVLETNRGRVILDYAHNAAAIAGVLDFVARMPAERRIAVISVPGDRRDEDFRIVGKLAAKMDFAIFKEHHKYRRGRAPGESAALLAEGLLSTGYPRERVSEFSEERDAVEHAITLMRPGSIAVIIADSPAVLEQFDAYVGAELHSRQHAV